MPSNRPEKILPRLPRRSFLQIVGVGFLSLFTSDIETLSPELIEGAGHLRIGYRINRPDTSGFDTAGSGYILVNNPTEGYFAAITAAHVLTRGGTIPLGESTVDILKLSQPQRDNSETFDLLGSSPPKVAVLTDAYFDIGLIAVRGANLPLIDQRKLLTVDPNWSPKPGMQLTSITFPVSGDSSPNIFHSQLLTVHSERGKPITYPGGKIKCRGKVSEGSSGSAVVHNGKLVAIITDKLEDSYYSLIAPLGSTFFRLYNQATGLLNSQ